MRENGGLVAKAARIHNRPLLPARLRLETLYEFSGACQSGRLNESEISEVVKTRRANASDSP